VENITALAAGGAPFICFVPDPVIHPAIRLLPTIKISANPDTVERMPTHVDVDLADMLRASMTIEQAARAIAKITSHVIGGAPTAAEKLDYLETNISRFGPSV
jgi:altronate dehydratase large subunit